MYDESVSDFFFINEFLWDKHLFMTDHLFYFKLFNIEKTVQEKRASTQLKSWKAPLAFFCSMQIFKKNFSKTQFYCLTEISIELR